MSVIAVIIIYNGCNFYNAKEASHDSIHTHSGYKNISRAELLNACQSCHTEQHQNEQLGPHTHAYQTLLEHKEYVNSNGYDLPGYATFVNQSLEKCIGCHAPQNLFEDIYAGFEFLPMSGLKEMDTDLFFTSPKSRESERLTGIDCLSCHYNGKDVLASKNFIEKKSNRSIEGYCFPKPSAFLSSDLLCTSCDINNYNNKDNFEQITSMNCNSCHTEKINNVSTHYTFWKNGKKEAPDSSYYNSIISSLNITNDKDKIFVQLKNASIPHLFNICRETVIKFEFKNNQNKKLLEKRIILNQKNTFLNTINHTAQFMKEAEAASEFGNVFEYNSEPTTFEVHKSKYKEIKKVEVSVITKGQYWHNDSTGVKTLNKVLMLN